MTTPDPAVWETLASGPLDDVDDSILRRLAVVYDVTDPVPDGLVERLRFAVTLDALNAELAELQQQDGLVASRGPDETKTLTFTSTDLTTMVTIAESGPDRVRIDGWCAPGGGMSVELRQPTVSVEVEADSDGRFVFDDVSHGLTRFVVRAPEPTSRPPVITPAVEL